MCEIAIRQSPAAQYIIMSWCVHPAAAIMKSKETAASPAEYRIGSLSLERAGFQPQLMS